jgi:hypothetical protein
MRYVNFVRQARGLHRRLPRFQSIYVDFYYAKVFRINCGFMTRSETTDFIIRQFILVYHTRPSIDGFAVGISYHKETFSNAINRSIP